MGKGLVGVVTKPIGGAAELVSQTGEYKQFTEAKDEFQHLDSRNFRTFILMYVYLGIGLLHGVGLTDMPHQRQQETIHNLSEFPNGSLKYHE